MINFVKEDTRNFITEDLDLIREVVQDEVDSELKIMLEGDTIRYHLNEIIDSRLKIFLLNNVNISQAGPGRGKVGRSCTKFSASLPTDLYEVVKSLPGLMSSHIDNALRLYLKVIE